MKICEIGTRNFFLSDRLETYIEMTVFESLHKKLTLTKVVLDSFSFFYSDQMSASAGLEPPTSS
mgnify:CR=1 FL=1